MTVLTTSGKNSDTSRPMLIRCARVRPSAGAVRERAQPSARRPESHRNEPLHGLNLLRLARGARLVVQELLHLDMLRRDGPPAANIRCQRPQMPASPTHVHRLLKVVALAREILH